MQAILGAGPGQMQQAQTVQATFSDLHRSLFSWTMHSGKVSINESGGAASGSPFSGATFSSNISCKRPRKNGAHAEQESWLSSMQDGGQNHSPECPLMRHEQAHLAEGSSKILRGSLSGEDSALGRELRQEQDDSRILNKEAGVACGCSVSHSATWTQGWHPRVDNSALGYEDAGLSGLQDVVSYTAVSFAAYRAIESERSDALFQDTLAEYLAGENVVKRQKAEVPHKDYPGARFAVRTKYFDLAMMSAVDELKERNPGAKVQVVLFGCGMDARGWRLPESNTQHSNLAPPAELLFEGDRPDVMRLKEQLLVDREGAGSMPALTLAKRRIALSVDFNLDTWQDLILKEGFLTTEPTVWLFEGLIMYLTPAGVANLVETVAKFSAPGSILLVDGISASAVERAKSSPSPVLRSWTWGSNDPEAYFNAHGWKVLSVDDVTGGMFGRVLPSWPGRESNLTWYMTARVQE